MDSDLWVITPVFNKIMNDESEYEIHIGQTYRWFRPKFSGNVFLPLLHLLGQAGFNILYQEQVEGTYYFYYVK